MKKMMRKADEMEMAINLKAARYAFCFLEIVMMGYCIVKGLMTGEFPVLILIFGLVGFAIFWWVKYSEMRKLMGIEEDEE